MNEFSGLSLEEINILIRKHVLILKKLYAAKREAFKKKREEEIKHGGGFL